MKKFRGLSALLAGFLLCLCACVTPAQAYDTKVMKLYVTVTVKDDKHETGEIKLLVSSAFIQQSGTSIDEMCEKMKTPGATTVKITEGDSQGCKTSMSSLATGAKGSFRHEGSYYVFDSTFEGNKDFESLGQLDDFVSDFAFTVNFPGKVVEHNGTSTVSGNSVTWTSLAELTAGLKAKGEDGVPVVTPTPTKQATAPAAAPAADKDKSDDHNGGMPVWAWALIGLVVLGGAATSIVMVMKNKKKTAAPAPVGYPQPGQPYGQAPYVQPGEPQAPQQYGQPAVPQTSEQVPFDKPATPGEGPAGDTQPPQ